MTTTDRRRLFLRADGLFAVPGTAESGGGMTPALHAATHEPGGSDELTLAQSQVTGLGQWIDVPFNAADFGAGGATWSVAAGNVLVNHYALIGKTVVWSLIVTAAALSAPTGTLFITLPAGLTAARLYDGPTRVAQLADAIGLLVGRAFVDGPTQIAVNSDGGPITGTASLQLTIMFEIL